MINLIELQNKIHQQNRELGWWDEERPFSTFVCLFHSELSEAMEGDRKGLMDDHLPEYPMFQVELADFVIRCFDFLGSQGFTDEDYNRVIEEYNSDGSEPWSSGCSDNCELLAELHEGVSISHLSNSASNISDRNEMLAESIVCCYSYSIENNFDLNQIILEKVEYNKHRADHKRENRALAGGKKY